MRVFYFSEENIEERDNENSYNLYSLNKTITFLN